MPTAASAAATQATLDEGCDSTPVRWRSGTVFGGAGVAPTSSELPATTAGSSTENEGSPSLSRDVAAVPESAAAAAAGAIPGAKCAGSAAPHLWQCSAATSLIASHRRQGFRLSCEPHWLQYLAPSGLTCPQNLHSGGRVGSMNGAPAAVSTTIADRPTEAGPDRVREPIIVLPRCSFQHSPRVGSAGRGRPGPPIPHHASKRATAGNGGGTISGARTAIHAGAAR